MRTRKLLAAAGRHRERPGLIELPRARLLLSRPTVYQAAGRFLIMLKTGLLVGVLSVTGVVAGCTHTNAQPKARTDFDPTADFARYHTYYWAGGKDANGKSSLENSLIGKRIKDIIGTQLWARGLGEVAENAKPDLVVLYWIGAKDKTSVETGPSSTMSARAV